MMRDTKIKVEERFPITGQGFASGKLLDGHRFEIFTLVSEIHDNVDLVMGMKNIFKLEGVIDL